jgi:hypothetical protein
MDNSKNDYSDSQNVQSSSNDDLGILQKKVLREE